MKINLIYFILFSSFIFFSLEQDKINKEGMNETFNKSLEELEDGFYKIKSYDNFSLFMAFSFSAFSSVTSTILNRNKQPSSISNSQFVIVTFNMLFLG